MKNNVLDATYEKLSTVLAPEQIIRGALLTDYTTFRIGGPADVLVLPHTLEELAEVLAVLATEDIAVTVLGGGSNVLVLDGGIRGVLVVLKDMQEKLATTEQGIVASAGFTMKQTSEFAAEHALGGLEFAVGIPGTLGGAIFMNAGAYGGEMSGIVSLVRSVDKQGHIHERTAAECEFAYRHSIFQDNEEIIAEIEFNLCEGEQEAIFATMADLTYKRESKQPLEWPSAGSTFKRPPGYFAGTLIEETGLKGFAVGDAEVSTKHAGFVINKGTASAQDVLDLIHAIQEKIKEEHGVLLEREVRLMGEK